MTVRTPWARRGCANSLRGGRSLGVEIRVKLIMLKLFEKYVLSDADHLYADANQLLVATGVLPELKVVLSAAWWAWRASISVQSACRRRINRSMKTASTPLPNCGNLLAAAGQRPPWKPAPSSSPSPPATCCACCPICSNMPEPGVEDDFDLRNQLKQLLTRVKRQERQIQNRGSVRRRRDQSGCAVVRIYLHDHAVPHAFKALIARLQIPMLKLAVLDKSLFSRASHPRGGCSTKSAAPLVGARVRITRVTACTCASSRWCSVC